MRLTLTGLMLLTLSLPVGVVAAVAGWDMLGWASLLCFGFGVPTWAVGFVVMVLEN